MAPGLRDADINRVGGVLDALGGQVHLAEGEIKLLPVVADPLPGLLRGVSVRKIFKGPLVSRKEHQGVGVLARTGATCGEHLLRPSEGCTVFTLLVGILGGHHHQTGGWFIGDGRTVGRSEVQPGKSTATFAFAVELLVQLHQQGVSVVEIALLVFVGSAVEVGLGVEPVAVTVLVEKTGLITQPP